MRPSARRAYALLLRLLPADFRERHRDAMEETFGQRLARARDRRARAGLWVREVMDLTRTGLRLRRGTAAAGGRTGMRTTTNAGRRGRVDDLVAAVRSLRRAPATTVTAVATLALGIGAATSLFSAVDRVLLRPVDLPEPERLIAVWRALGTAGSLRLSPDEEVAEQLRGAEGSFDAVLGFASRDVVLSGEGDPLPLQAGWTDPGFFDLAEARAVAGRLLARGDETQAVAMISEDLWRRLGSDPGRVGGTLRLDGVLHTIVGVAPRGLRHPSPLVDPPEVWLPLESEVLPGPGVSSVLARLAPGVSLEAARAAVEGINISRTEAGTRGTIELMRLGDLETRSLREPVTVLMAAVLLLLALSWASVAGLLLARAEARTREAAVRTALGATRARLARQRLVESLLLSGAAAALGVGLAWGALGLLRGLRPDNLKLLDGMSLDGRVLAFAGGTALAATLLFGAIPALRAGGGRVAGLLRAGTTGAASGARARRWLVVGELALSFTLLVGAVQVARTLAGAANRDTGFEHEGLVVLEYSLPAWRFPDVADREAAHRRILERVRALPGVTAALGAVPPGVGIFFGELRAEGAEAAEGEGESGVYFGTAVGVGWVETLGVRVLRGRSFEPADAESEARVWLLGESLARELFPPDGDAVGRRIRLSETGEWGPVVGVIEDVLATGGLGPVEYGQMWAAAGPESGGTLAVRSSMDRGALAAALRSALAEVDPEIPVDGIGTVEQHYRRALARERLVGLLLAAFAATAALLAVVGLYGVLAQVVRTRLREFGIRLSLGAAPSRVFRGVLGAGGLTVALGLVAGGIGAAAGLRLLGSRVPGLEGSDPAAFVASGLLLGAVSLLAIGVPAARASRADPVTVLRSE